MSNVYRHSGCISIITLNSMQSFIDCHLLAFVEMKSNNMSKKSWVTKYLAKMIDCKLS